MYLIQVLPGTRSFVTNVESKKWQNLLALYEVEQREAIVEK